MPVYQKLSDDEIKNLASRFGVHIDSNPELLVGGSANVNYLISSSMNKYVLAVCEGKSAKEIQVLFKLLRHLEDNQFSTSRIFSTVSGEAYVLHQGKPVILKSYLEGDVPNRLSAAEAYALGKRMGQLHKITSPDYLPRQHDYDLHAFSSLSKQIKGHPFADWVNEVSGFLEQSIPQSLPKGLIHGDIFCDNLVSNADEIIIMDFEEVCHHFLLFDLGMAVVGTCCPDENPDSTLIENLLSGYESSHSLASSESALIDLFAFYAAAGTAVWRFRQFNLVTPSDEMSDHYRKMMNLAEKFRGRL